MRTTGLLLPFFMVLVAYAVGGYLDFRYDGQVLPGVRWEGVDVGGKSLADANQFVRDRTQTLRMSPLSITHIGREWRPTALEIGLSIDDAQMARDAVTAGRTWPVLVRWLGLAVTPIWHPQIFMRAAVNRATLNEYLVTIGQKSVDRPPVEPLLTIKNGQVQVIAPVAGERVDVEATATQLRIPADATDRQTIALVVVPVSARTTPASVIEAQRTAQKILAGPLFVRAGDKSWTLSLPQLEAMIEIRRAPALDGERLVVTLNEREVSAFVRSVAEQVDRSPQDGQIRWDGKAIAFVREGLDGQQLDQPSATRLLIESASFDSRDVVLPVLIAPATISRSRFASMGIRDLLGVGSSRFTGSPVERANNVKVAAEKLHHVLIPSGSTFSFLQSLGPITPENGYLEGLTIQGDATVPGIGGGVCQVSTTLFRSAFYAGLPIIERHQHVYRVAYYEQDGSPIGFDAAVYDPGVDFRFKNDTGSAILLHVTVDAPTSTLVFRLFGEPIGRDVKMAASRANVKAAPPPAPDVADPKLNFGFRKQIEWKSDGADATVRRTITSAGGVAVTDTFSSKYPPWQEKWALGTGPIGAKTPAIVRTAVAQGDITPGAPTMFVALQALVSPPSDPSAVTAPPPTPP